MNRDEITEIVLSIVKDTLFKLDDVEKITSETNLIDLGADSLDTFEIVVYIEKRFYLCISDSDAEQLCRNATVDKFVDYIVEHL